MNKYLNFIWTKMLFVFGYPVILSFVLEALIQEVSYSVFPNLIENILFGTILITLINQLVYFKLGRKIAKILIVLFYSILVVETGLFLLFQIRINAAYIYVVLNTNINEIKEFSSVYYSNNLIWLALFIIPVFFYSSFKKTFKPQKKTLESLSVSLVLIIILIFTIKINHLGKWNLPFITVKSYLQYEKQLKEIEATEKNIGSIKTKLTTENETIVVIIGESTTRSNMGIYDYYRNTTPMLKAMNDSLYVYNDVITSKVYTTGAIYDAFYKKNDDSTSNTPNSLLHYLNASGYKTYWISNQRPVGLNDNLVSKLASVADESTFLSYNDYRHKTYYDEILLPILDKKLLNKKNKVIFLHLIGTHYDYRKRYPSEFSNFSSNKHDKKNEIIDSYDNAILYNDFIISQVIKRVSKSSKKSAVIYFSDHGEEVFNKRNFFGHFQDKPTSAMYEIPFLVYMSSNFEKPKDFEVDESRKYIMSDFIHSLIHFTGIETEFLDKSRSIFSAQFIGRKRIIQGNIGFDNFKLSEEQ